MEIPLAACTIEKKRKKSLNICTSQKKAVLLQSLLRNGVQQDPYRKRASKFFYQQENVSFRS